MTSFLLADRSSRRTGSTASTFDRVVAKTTCDMNAQFAKTVHVPPVSMTGGEVNPGPHGEEHGAEVSIVTSRLALPLHKQAAFRRVLEAPLAMAYPNGQFPATNDSDPASIDSFSDSFRWAWETYAEERFAQAYANSDATKRGALLGPAAEPKPFLESRPANLEGTGLAILRRGRGADAACVMLDHGPHGGAHGHFDKLGVVVYAAGQECCSTRGG